jgi:hypothetical protein
MTNGGFPGTLAGYHRQAIDLRSNRAPQPVTESTMRFANVYKSPVQPGEYVGVTQDDVVFATYAPSSTCRQWSTAR